MHTSHRHLRPFRWYLFCALAAAMGLAMSNSAFGQHPILINVVATVSATPSPQVVLSWDAQLAGWDVTVSRRIMGAAGGASSWQLRSTVAFPTRTFTDAISEGVIYEYRVFRPGGGVRPDGQSLRNVSGFSSVTLNAPVVHTRGKLLLVVDNTMAGPLAAELTQLEMDLAGDGWTVQRMDSARHGAGTPAALRAAIQAAYNADPVNVKAVYLFGRLPIPRSGWSAPDGHNMQTQHADGFYGDMDGVWTDTTNLGTGNIPGDGHFDPDYFPSKLELMVGRVDLAGMTNFRKTEVEYLRDYIHKSHAFRNGRRTEVSRRGLHNGGFLFQEYNWLFTMFGGVPLSGDGFYPQLATNPHLFAVGVGPAGGNDSNYINGPTKMIFGINFASGKQYWGDDNNQMRALLAQPDWGLTCAWGARPAWYFHHMSAGQPVGYSALQTMNNWRMDLDYAPFGDTSIAGHVLQSLMGDPTLRLHPVAPPESAAVVKSGASAVVSWQPSLDTAVSGYHVYSSTNRLGLYTLLTATAVTGTTFTDVAPPAGDVFYQVRAFKRETTTQCFYANTSQGAFAKLNADGSANRTPAVQAGNMSAPQNQLTPVVFAGTDPDTGDTLTPIVLTNPVLGELRWTGSAASYSPRAGTIGTDTIRYVLSDGVTTSTPVTITVASTPAGIVEVAATTMKVSKTVGTAQIGVTRTGGTTGAITLTYTVASSSALAGTHFTLPSSTTLSWADGETGVKNIPVPITATPSPQQPRQFVVTLGSVTNGAAIGLLRTVVLIEDPTAILPGPWSQAIVGSVIGSSPAVEAEGALGSVTLGGAGLSTDSQSEAGRFIHQSRTGDGVMTAFVPNASPAQPEARFAVMVRSDSSSGNGLMAATVTSGSSATNFGSKFIYRTAQNARAVVTGTAPTASTPRWIRLTRAGNTFTSESSANGTTWTLLGTANVLLPATAQWGVFHLSAAPVLPNVYGDFQLATFQSISVGNLPATSTPVNFQPGALTSTSATFTWTASALASGYRIERRSDNGSMDLFDIPSGSTVTYTDSTAQPDTAYRYRIVAYNSSGDSAWSALTPVATPPRDITLNLLALADATVTYVAPTTNFGGQHILTVTGIDNLRQRAPLAKAWLRFDLSGLPPLKTAKLNLAIAATRNIEIAEWYYSFITLLPEVADGWDESTITWNNAVRNDTTSGGLIPPDGAIGGGLIPPNYSLGVHYISSERDLPAAGTVMTSALDVTHINSHKGANGLITIVLHAADQNVSAVDWASRENTTLAPPTLMVGYPPVGPSRPSFLTATPGGGSSTILQWTDNAVNETGFALERRPFNGAWTPLQTLPANTTTFTDSTSLPGVLYEYRVRGNNASGNSSWATTSGRLQPTSAATVTSAVWSPDSVVFNQVDISQGNGYGPTGFTYYRASVPLATGQTLGNPRNNFPGWVGMKITVGDTPIAITELSRWVVSGNTGAHTVKLVDATTDLDVPGGAVTLQTSGAPVGFLYAPLATPLTLAAGAAYYIVSQEFTGGDQWCDPSLLTAPSSAVTINSAVSKAGAGPFALGFGLNRSFGPLNFKYVTVPPGVPFITAHSMSALRNDYTGWMGMKILVGASDMVVNQLGRWVVPGNIGTHTVKLVNAATGANVASANVATLGAPAGQFKYTPLASPVTLAANTSFYVLSQETAGGDQWYDFATPTAGTATGYQNWLQTHGLSMDGTGTGSATATPANDGLPNLMKYALGLNPGVSGNGGRLSYGDVTDAGSNYLTFIYTRPEPRASGLTYTVEASADLSAGSWSSSGLVEVSSLVNGSTRTVTIRDTVPMAGAAKRFMRLKVTQP